MTEAAACGKVILVGEHAVVYGQPAIAVPLAGPRARATVTAAPTGSGIVLVARDLGTTWQVEPEGVMTGDEALPFVVARTLRHLGLPGTPDLHIELTSDLPVASGLGSSAAVAVSLIRAIAGYFGRRLEPAAVSALAFEAERLQHGTPSGIDNTVVAYEQPVWFVRGQGMETFAVGRPLRLLIGDTGLASSTRDVVGDVRVAWQGEPARYEALFAAIGQISHWARQAIEQSDLPALGRLLSENHRLLQNLGVSCGELDRLAAAATSAGALGAKLSGAGRGGNMIALVQPEAADAVATALRAAGARRVVATEVAESSRRLN
jgi:mevalonate kinase